MTGGRDEFAQLLGKAGLDVLGKAEDVLPPWAAWRPVIAFQATPAVAVRSDRPDLVAEINAQWRRLATDHGILGEDGVFLLDVAAGRAGGTPPGWTRVRLTPTWDLAGVLGDRPGQPEFLTLSADGDTLLGVTTEEYEVWLVAVDGLGRRQEEQARAAARETPQERERAWASLAHGPRPTKRLLEMWAHGLARNPAAPGDVLRSLPGHTDHLPSRDPLRYAGDPNPRMRGLALGDPDSAAELVERLSRDISEEVRLRAAMDPRLSAASAVRLLDDPRESVRREAARHARLPARVLLRLLRDSSTAEIAAQNPSLPIDVMRQMARLLPTDGPGQGS